MSEDNSLIKKKLALDEFSGEPLTDLENRKIRQLLETEARVSWLWATLWVWTRGALVVLGSVWLVHEWIGQSLEGLSKLFK